jgi:putative (di)nucleoside polyphosphate hydrolase
MIDRHGFRANVGIILLNECGQVFCARRSGMAAWQFPQGGIKRNETPESAMFRELKEEIGLERADVELLGATKGWLRYRLPKRFIRYHQQPLCIGQKQIWFLLRLLAADSNVRLDLTAEQEFDAWRWADYWEPLGFVVSFKRNVYERALHEFSDYVGDLWGIAGPNAPDRSGECDSNQP